MVSLFSKELCMVFPMSEHLKLSTHRKDQKWCRKDGGLSADWDRCIISMDGDKKTVHCSFPVLSCWRLAIVVSSLMTWAVVCRGNKQLQETFAHVRDADFVFWVLWMENTEPCPACLSQIPHSYHSHLKCSSHSLNPDKFSSRQVAYLWKSCVFEDFVFLCLLLLLKG